MLFYGLETQRFSKARCSSICYPYNCTYTKLFTTFDKVVITLCQFFSGELPSEYKIDIQTLNFYAKLSNGGSNPSYILLDWFGQKERIDILNKYGINDYFKNFGHHIAIENHFKQV